MLLRLIRAKLDLEPSREYLWDGVVDWGTDNFRMIERIWMIWKVLDNLKV